MPGNHIRTPHARDIFRDTLSPANAVLANMDPSPISIVSPGLAMTDHAYEPGPIKRRRSTASQIVELKANLHSIVSIQRPMTVRQCFYRATVAGLVEKTEAGYKQVQRILAGMRRAGEMPYSWLTDSSRSVYRRDSFDGPEEAAAATARFYRKALWTNANCRVEVWLEKDALSGVLLPVTDGYDVGLYVTRGFSSLSFLHAAAEQIAGLDVPAFIYHLGDRDPSGVKPAARSRKHSANWRLMRRSILYGLPSLNGRSPTCIFHPARPRSAPTPGVGRETVSSLMPSSRMCCGPSSRRQSSGTCRSMNGMSSRRQNGASVKCCCSGPG